MMIKTQRLFDQGKYDRAFMSYTMSLINSKKNYDKKHKMIDKILKIHTLSDDTFNWLKGYGNRESKLILAKVYILKKMYKECVNTLKWNNTPMALNLHKSSLAGLRGFKKDEIKLFKKNANFGDSDAQFSLGCIYSNINDDKNTIKYLKLSSNQGNLKASYKLALFYEKKFDTNEAIKYYKLCENNIEAYHSLVRIYEKKDDIENVLKYYYKIIELGDLMSIERVAKMYREAYSEFPNYPSHLKRAFLQKSIKIHRKRIDSNNPKVLYHLATFDHESDTKDILRRCAHLGHVKGQYLYGERYADPDYYVMAATQDHRPSLYKLGKYYKNKNQEKAISYYNRALEMTIDDDWEEQRMTYSIKSDLCEIYKSKRYKSKIYIPIKLLRLYSTHNCISLINHICNANPDILKDILQSAYHVKNLNAVGVDVLNLECGKIKMYIETNNMYDLFNNMIKYVNIYFEYQDSLINEMRKRLDDTPLYVKSLHDIIEEYL
jgi:TPR repeat protein